MNAQSRENSYSCIYDFSSDPSAGAIGTVDLKLAIPGVGSNLEQIREISVCAISTLTGGVGATLSFGLKSNNSTGYVNAAGVNVGVVSKPTALMGVTAIGALNGNVDSEGFAQPLQGSVSAAGPLKVGFNGQSWNMTMTIGTAALTGGKLQIVVTTNVQNQ